MANVFGKNITITLFGESHGKYIGATLDGVAPGIKIDEEYINSCLLKRRPRSKIETSRVEKDEYEFVSGVFNSYTTGAPLTVLIKNEDVNSSTYEENKNIARPSHVDYVSHIKYEGYEDYRGGGHFSGRLTAPIVVLGAVLKRALEAKNIYIGTHIKKCGEVVDRDFISSKDDITLINSKTTPVLNDIEKDIENEILKVAAQGDSVGGILQTVVTGLEVGLGEPYFSSLESEIASAMFSIGGVKGIEFGLGFEFANRVGSTSNDEFVVEGDKIITKTNNNGGINGGISNGMDVLFNIVVKPTPSISKTQNTVDFVNKENVELKIIGRHDPAFIRRLAIVVECLTALVISDFVSLRHGTNYLKEGK